MKEKIAYDYDYFSVSIIWGRSVRLTETLVIMLPSIGVLLQKQVSPKMFNHAAINVSQLKTNLVCKGASESLTCYLWPSLSCRKKKKDLASVCWNKWWTFTFTGAKEQLWLQVWLHFIKQFPMHCFFFLVSTCIVTYPCHCGVIRNISNETDVFTHSSVQQECVWLCIPFFPPILRQIINVCYMFSRRDCAFVSGK